MQRYIILGTEEKVIDGKVYRERIAEAKNIKQAFSAQIKNITAELYKQIDINEDVEIKEK